MRALRFIALAVILAALLILPATNRTVDSVAGTQEADQANVAKTTDSTYTSGSVDLEGVPEDDTTTFTFSTTEQPDAAKANPAEQVQFACLQPALARPLQMVSTMRQTDWFPRAKRLRTVWILSLAHSSTIKRSSKKLMKWLTGSDLFTTHSGVESVTRIL